jgi:hypothetical protein
VAGSFRRALEDAGRGDLISRPAETVGEPVIAQAEPAVEAPGTHRQIDWRQLFGVEGGIGISVHAAERYRERFGSKFDRVDVARDQLRARLDVGIVAYSRERPPWLVIVAQTANQRPENHAGYLIVDEEIVLPLRRGRSRTQPFYAVTCIARQDAYSSRGSGRGMGGGMSRRRRR